MGMENSFPKIREREGNEKKPFPKFVNGKGMKTLPKAQRTRGLSSYHKITVHKP